MDSSVLMMPKLTLFTLVIQVLINLPASLSKSKEMVFSTAESLIQKASRSASRKNIVQLSSKSVVSTFSVHHIQRCTAVFRSKVDSHRTRWIHSFRTPLCRWTDFYESPESLCMATAASIPPAKPPA